MTAGFTLIADQELAQLRADLAIAVRERDDWQAAARGAAGIQAALDEARAQTTEAMKRLGGLTEALEKQDVELSDLEQQRDRAERCIEAIHAAFTLDKPGDCWDVLSGIGSALVDNDFGSPWLAARQREGGG